MLRLSIRSGSAFAALACAAASALTVACGDASVGSSQDWVNQSPSHNTGGSTSSTGTTTTNDDSEDAGTTAVDPGDASDDVPPADGATGDGSTDGGSIASDKLAVTSTMSTAALDLMSTVKIPVQVAPLNGFTGMASLAVMGLPADVTATWDSSTFTLGASPVIATLTLTSLSTTVQQMNNYSVVATPASGMPATAPMHVMVNSKITIHLPVNLENTYATSKVNGGKPIVITAPANLSATNPIVIMFHNDDASEYFQIHAGSDSVGFRHGDFAIAPQADETYKTGGSRVINAKATGVGFYIHGNGTTAAVAVTSNAGPSDFAGSFTVQ